MKMIMLLMMLADGASAAAPEVQLLDFTAGYCGPCQQMVPVMQRMERDGFPIRRIDISEEPELTQQFNVSIIPTFVLMVEGQPVKRFTGLTDEAELRGEMNKAARRLRDERLAKTSPQTVEAPDSETPFRPDVPAEQGDTQTKTATTNAPRPSVGDIFRGLIGRDARPTAFQYPTLRAQSPEPVDAALTGLDAAVASTVRVRVSGTSTEDGKNLQDVGTGTIVYSAPGQAIILTCAHFFLNVATADAVVEIEVFEDAKPAVFKAAVLGGDHNSDLAFVKIQSAKALPCVRLADAPPEVLRAQQLVSFGCDLGNDPTRLNTRLVDINRYNGPENLVCTTDPVVGRSGGGLFSLDGELVGVCSCADRKKAEGLYMAYGAITKLIDRLGLRQILLKPKTTSGEDAAAVFSDLMAGGSGDPAKKEGPAGKIQQREIDRQQEPEFDGDGEGAAEALTSPLEGTSELLTQGPPAKPGTESASTDETPGATATVGPEITIIIDDKQPGSQKKVIIIPQASSWMVELLTGESEDGMPISRTMSASPARGAASAKPLLDSDESRNFPGLRE